MGKRRDQIITTAAGLFRERGYSAVTMRDLAQAVNLQAASLYNHISGKQEILSHIILDLAGRFTAGMDEVVMGGDSAFAKAEKLINLHINLALSKTDALAVMNNDWMHLEGEPYQEYKAQRREYDLAFRNILKEGIATAEFKDHQVDTVLFAFLSTLRTLYLYLPKKSAEEIDLIRIQLPQILLKGLSR